MSVALFCMLAASQRVVVLGFDGVDWKLAREMMDEGQLPNLQALAKKGSFLKLISTNPAQSPVAWSTIITGLNPGKTGITGFLKRPLGDRASYAPELATAAVVWTETTRSWWLVAIVVLVVWAVPFVIVRRRKLLRLLLPSGLAVPAGVVVAVLVSLIPEQVPRVVCTRKGTTVWEIADEHDIPSTVLWAPISFPPRPLKHSRVLCGLGVPDARGMPYSWMVFDAREKRVRETETGGIVAPLVRKNGSYTATVRGPLKLDARLEIERLREMRREGELDPASADEKIVHLCREEALRELSLDDGDVEFEGRSEKLSPGGWSDTYSAGFPVAPLAGVRTVTEFYLVRRGEEPRLFMGPLSFDPAHPPAVADLSYPRSYSRELARRYGSFKTPGWSVATHPVKDDEADDALLATDVLRTEEMHKKMCLGELSRDDWRLFFAVFEDPDRIQHIFWRHTDPAHPRHDPELARQWGGFIREFYVWIDGVVGEARRIAPDAHFIVLSDHGFASVRRLLNINTWLLKEGYLVLTSEGRHMSLENLRAGTMGAHIDFSKTRAYSLGLGKVFINLKGREPLGIVEPEDRRGLVLEICRGLEAIRDGTNVVVKRAYPRWEMMHGPEAEGAADIFLGFMPGYRVSWQTCLLGVPPRVLEDNKFTWSGDHCSLDPEEIPGIFISDVPARGEVIQAVEVAPSMLALLGLSAREGRDGQTVFPINP